MRFQLLVSMVGVALASSAVYADASAQQQHLNPVIGLLEQGKPVMGLYRPSNRPFGRAPAAPGPEKSEAELAHDALAYKAGDYVFDGSMEHDFDKSFPVFSEFAAALSDAGAYARKPFHHLTHPLIVKIPEIAPDPAKAASYIGAQLNAGVSGIMFVGVESPEEVRQGIAAMRFKSQGGTRAEEVGTAPKFWGLSEQDYRQKADLWPLNPAGELLNWVVVESKAGLENVREIAAVKGIGVLWPGAGTLRGVFSTTGADGKRVLDEAAWEAAIQKVLAACKEFDVPCGYPAGSPDDIEKRMKQGFSVFVMGWGDAGFKTVEHGRKLAGRAGAYATSAAGSSR